jgi:hypothetical protein
LRRSVAIGLFGASHAMTKQTIAVMKTGNAGTVLTRIVALKCAVTNQPNKTKEEQTP